jgi:hypothetical protein
MLKKYVISLCYKKNCNCAFKQLYLGNHSEQDTSSYKICLRMADTMTSQNIDLSSWDTLCMLVARKMVTGTEGREYGKRAKSEPMG